MIKKEQAELAVYDELRSRKLKKRITQADLVKFCQEMSQRLQFRSKSDPMQDIRAWTERWQNTQLWNG